MTDTPTATDAKRPLWRRLLRFRSFACAYLCCATALLGFVVWILLDASFDVINASWSRLIVEPSSEDGRRVLFPMWSTMWYWFPMRMGLYLLLAAAAAEGVVVLCRLFVGKRGGRSVRSFLFATALVAGWSALFVGYQDLKWAGVWFRLQRRLPELKRLAEELRENWPAEDTVLPIIGEVKVEGMVVFKKYSGLFPTELPLNELTGEIIRRGEDGAIRLTVFVYGTERPWMLEFLPPGATPVSFDDVFDDVIMRHPLRRFWKLDRHAYLATYGRRQELPR